MIHDLEDNYVDFLDDAIGYRWEAWDVLPLGQIDQHDAIFENGKTDDAFDLSSSDDLCRWAFCRGRRSAGDEDSFLEGARLILAGDRTHIAIAYDEIFVATIETLSRHELFDEARLLLEKAIESYGEQSEFDRVAANVNFREDVENGRIHFVSAQEKHPDDAEFAFDLAEDLLSLGDADGAIEMAKIVESLCDSSNAIWVDLQSLNRRITEARTSV